jgi:hypothetical protein
VGNPVCEGLGAFCNQGNIQRCRAAGHQLDLLPVCTPAVELPGNHPHGAAGCSRLAARHRSVHDHVHCQQLQPHPPPPALCSSRSIEDGGGSRSGADSDSNNTLTGSEQAMALLGRHMFLC